MGDDRVTSHYSYLPAYAVHLRGTGQAGGWLPAAVPVRPRMAVNNVSSRRCWRGTGSLAPKSGVHNWHCSWKTRPAFATSSKHRGTAELCRGRSISKTSWSSDLKCWSLGYLALSKSELTGW